ncbi:hypothetical protein UFOVP1033_96 [uncultured Caudovirales phage]|uniref:Uncharacterized protein n=1 Tax=uncultured Caudovirales phage TaxID=2100421 RepID=A0A6J5SZI9_9CAUD|nr:hypothetical protein UFOVP1033_96 [uncultured Caudovirales phage]CAB4220888.1 hypothetical protein UFOVP1631_96 [uncultured Caudovirales phage]
MTELSEHQTDLIKSITIANEFLKIVRGFKIDAERTDSLPQDVKEYLANEHLNSILKEKEIEPEMLVWGFMHMIEILLKYADLDPEDLTQVMDHFVKYVIENPEQYTDRSTDEN